MKKTEERLDRLERIAKLLVRAGLRARREMRQQDDFSIRKLKGVMMRVQLVFVDLLKLRDRVLEAPREYNASIETHLFLEGKFGAGE